MGSVFDAPPGQLKADGQMHQTGMGAPTQNAPQQGAPQPVQGGTQPTAAAAGPIGQLITALVSALSPATANRGRQLQQQEHDADPAPGADSLGSQF